LYWTAASLLILFSLIFFVSGCDLPNGGDTTDEATIVVRVSVTVKDRSSGSVIQDATVTIKPTVAAEGHTYYFEEESGRTNSLGVVSITAEQEISSSSSDIIETKPKISVTITHDTYETKSFVDYGTGFTWDEDKRIYTSSLTIVEFLSS
jgi:hypothetical protein